jgi:hypothetical protein
MTDVEENYWLNLKMQLNCTPKIESPHTKSDIVPLQYFLQIPLQFDSKMQNKYHRYGDLCRGKKIFPPAHTMPLLSLQT